MACNKGYLAHIYDSFEELSSMDVIIAYEGYATHQVLKAFTELVEEKLEEGDENECIRRQLHHVLVECIQNINRHGKRNLTEDGDYLPGRGGLLICSSDEAFRVITANFIDTAYMDGIRETIDSINPLSDQELYDLYKKQLKEGSISSKGGAGVGLIDMRRKTANKLEYDFVDCDKDKSACTENGIRGYPSWIIDENLFQGDQPLKNLALMAGCEW